MKDVSVIIVNYNTSALIKDLLNSLYTKTEGISYEVIVVDNNPTEQFTIDLKDYLDKIIYIPLEENVGFGRANNEGVKVAKGRNIFFLNPDTLLVNNAIKILSNYLDANKEVGVCGGNLYDANGAPTHSYQMTFPSITWELNLFFGKCWWYRLVYGKSYTFNYTSKNREVAYITGADMMVKRHVLEEVGAFNPAFFMYYEETELSYRIHKNGYKIVNIPEVKITHLEGKSISTNFSKQQMLLTSRKTYYTLTVGKKIIDDAICKFTFWTRLVVSTLKGRKEEVTYWKNSIKLV